MPSLDEFAAMRDRQPKHKQDDRSLTYEAGRGPIRIRLI